MFVTYQRIVYRGVVVSWLGVLDFSAVSLQVRILLGSKKFSLFTKH